MLNFWISPEELVRNSSHGKTQKKSYLLCCCQVFRKLKAVMQGFSGELLSEVFTECLNNHFAPLLQDCYKICIMW